MRSFSILKILAPASRKYTSVHEVESFLKKNKMISTTEKYSHFLEKNKMTSAGEEPEEMFDRVAKALAFGGASYYGKEKTVEHYKIFKDLISSYRVILSTPIYTNAGRHTDKPLSACAVPSIDFKTISPINLQSLVNSYHIKGMGTGFNFDSAEDPVRMLKILNSFAMTEVQQGQIERPVGNMGILSVDHPKVMEFAQAKLDPLVREWKFNISINLNNVFFQALKDNRMYKQICPMTFLTQIAECAKQTGDPGVIFMEQFEKNNKVPHLGRYVSVAPCGEVPLLDGETCQFSYINLYEFVQKGEINYSLLRSAIHHTMLMLDNALEISIQKLPTDVSASIVSKIRKVGLGVCGFSDALMTLGLSYHSPAAIKLAENIISFINYESKMASVNLAKSRGPFPAFFDARTRKDLMVGPYVERATDTVSTKDWMHLAQLITMHGVRHVSTVILPPTGRSSLLGGVSASIEPHFKLTADIRLLRNLKQWCNYYQYQGDLNLIFDRIDKTGSVQTTDLPDQVKQIFLTCLEITPEAHLAMAAAFQKFTDEAISKTVNLSQDTDTKKIVSIYTKAYDLGLKGITVYLDRSRFYQPKQLAEKSVPLTTLNEERGVVSKRHDIPGKSNRAVF